MLLAANQVLVAVKEVLVMDEMLVVAVKKVLVVCDLQVVVQECK